MIRGEYNTCKNCKHCKSVLDSLLMRVVGHVCTYPIVSGYFIEARPGEYCKYHEVQNEG